MNQHWWCLFLQLVFWGALLAVIVGAYAKSRRRPRPAPNARAFRYPTYILIIGLLGILFGDGFAIISNVYRNETATIWTTSAFMGFAVLGLWLVVEYLFEQNEVSADGLFYFTLFGRTVHMDWPELTNVRYVPVLGCFRLETRSGKVTRISSMLEGLPELATLLLKHIPSTAIEPRTLPILQAAASGVSPTSFDTAYCQSKSTHESPMITSEIKNSPKTFTRLFNWICFALLIVALSLMYWAEHYNVVWRYSMFLNAPHSLLIASCIGMLLLTSAIALWIYRRTQMYVCWGSMIVYCFMLGFSLLFSFTQLGLIVNGAADNSQPRIYQTVAVSKRIGSRSSHCYLNVKDWNQPDRTIQLSVSRLEYDTTETGTTLQVVTKPGFLGYEWIVSQSVMKK